jgi:hypothetical protein
MFESRMMNQLLSLCSLAIITRLDSMSAITAIQLCGPTCANDSAANSASWSSPRESNC